MAKIDRILRAVESTPWAIQPEKLEQIAQVLIARAEAGAFPDATEIEAMEARQSGKMSTQGAIQVMQLFGTISRRMGMLDAMSGGSSIETFSKAFDAAVADNSISHIVIEIHSPGGSVYGVEELFQKIFSARSKKRITGVVDSMAASAAYYIASACSELVVSPSGEVGSIGVYTIHFDWSEAMAAEGVKATIVKAGEHKAEGNPYEPLSEDAIAHTQMMVDDYYDQFIRAVSKGRGVPVAKVKSDFGQGRTYTAKRALQRGMVDRIATMDQVLADIQSGKAPSRSNAEGVTLDLVAAAATAVTMGSGNPIPSTVHIDLPDPNGSADLPAPDFSAIQNTVGEAVSRFAYAIKNTHPDAAAAEATNPDSDPPSAAVGQDALVATNAPTEPAPEAREDSMSVQDTAAPTAGAPNAEEILAAERKRSQDIRAIGQAHTIEETVVTRWIDAGLPVDQVNAEALKIIQTRRDAGAIVQVGHDRALDKPFASLGQQLQLIAAAARSPELADKRLVHLNEEYAKYQAAASGSSVGVPSDGGFVIQPDFAEGVTTKMWNEGQVLSRTNRVPIGENSNGLVRNQILENSRAAGYRYGGVRVYRAAEAATVTATKPKMAQQRIYLDKLMGLYYATDETMQDAVALTTEAEKGFRKELTFVAENEVFRGTGAGECLGILNSDALVSVAKESAQVAATVNATNVAKMMGRFAGSFATGAWFIHTSVIPQLVLMTIGDQPVFLPGGSLVGRAFGTLFGMPVIPVEYCSGAGTVGDIILADLDLYTTIDKGGAKWAESVHVRFIYDETAFKLTYRFNGQPDWETSVLEANGSDYVSPFVTLAVRS